MSFRRQVSLTERATIVQLEMSARFALHVFSREIPIPRFSFLISPSSFHGMDFQMRILTLSAEPER